MNWKDDVLKPDKIRKKYRRWSTSLAAEQLWETCPVEPKWQIQVKKLLFDIFYPIWPQILGIRIDLGELIVFAVPNWFWHRHILWPFPRQKHHASPSCSDGFFSARLTLGVILARWFFPNSSDDFCSKTISTKTCQLNIVKHYIFVWNFQRKTSKYF